MLRGSERDRLPGAEHVPLARSLRRDGELTARKVADLGSGVVEAVRAALAHEGSVGVIAAEPDLPHLREALATAGIGTTVTEETGTAEDTGPTPRVTVLAATVAKGLEYDHVVVVEPATIADGQPRGLNSLYVALTRAVSRLDVLHRRPLPEAMAG